MRRSLLCLVVAATPAFAQQQQSADMNVAVNASKMTWNTAHTYVLKSAEQVPESLYAFKPTPEVRSIGQLIGHVAGAQYAFCAAALGEPMKPEYDVEKTKTSKADLVAALKASAEYCQRAYAQSDASAAAMTKFFGRDATRMWVLSLNGAHVFEHYGNLVTYMRIKGMTPPSSQM